METRDLGTLWWYVLPTVLGLLFIAVSALERSYRIWNRIRMVISWLALASAFGSSYYTVAWVCEYAYWGRYAGVFIFEFIIAVMAIIKLAQSYTEDSADWRGRWQFSLTDLMIVVLLFGLAMLTIRAADPIHFSTKGIWIAVVIGVAFSSALLVAIREGDAKPGIWTRLRAMVLLLYALSYLFVGALLQVLFVFCIQACFR